ncbi:hypothetical protein HanPSC8_Chr06g0242781 [Helianthus annuus]|nr:hypothetical protein HanPSC8_Chr06g0242781 [Helianthus annuus]
MNFKNIYRLFTEAKKPDKQETTPPDNILEDDMLALLLKPFSGFKDVKIIYAKLGIAFLVFDEKKNFLLQRNPHRAQDHPLKMSFLQKLKKIVLCVGIKMHNGVCVNVWFNLKKKMKCSILVVLGVISAT